MISSIPLLLLLWGHFSKVINVCTLETKNFSCVMWNYEINTKNFNLTIFPGNSFSKMRFDRKFNLTIFSDKFLWLICEIKTNVAIWQKNSLQNIFWLQSCKILLVARRGLANFKVTADCVKSEIFSRMRPPTFTWNEISKRGALRRVKRGDCESSWKWRAKVPNLIKSKLPPSSPTFYISL